MANIDLVAEDRVGLVNPVDAYLRPPQPVADDYPAGTPVYIDGTTGKLVAASAADLATARVAGITTRGSQAALGVTTLIMGEMEGFDLDGINYNALVYLSDTPGRISDTPGSVVVPLGIVQPAYGQKLGSSPDKVISFFIQPAGPLFYGPPAVPHTLAVEADSTSQITVTWTEVANADEYDLRYSDDEETWTVLLDQESPKAITTLSPSTEYFVQIRAVNAYGASAWSESVSATTNSE